MDKNKNPTVKTVVQGEASESDEEEEQEVQKSKVSRVPQLPTRLLHGKLSSPAATARKVHETKLIETKTKVEEILKILYFFLLNLLFVLRSYALALYNDDIFFNTSTVAVCVDVALSRLWFQAECSQLIICGVFKFQYVYRCTCTVDKSPPISMLRLT